MNVACSVRRCGACLRWYSMSVMNLRSHTLRCQKPAVSSRKTAETGSKGPCQWLKWVKESKFSSRVAVSGLESDPSPPRRANPRREPWAWRRAAAGTRRTSPPSDIYYLVSILNSFNIYQLSLLYRRHGTKGTKAAPICRPCL